jgi:predicted enzyme related to lactoylglutathione lyase
MEPTSIADVRRIAVLRDPQGAVFGVYADAGEG